MSQAPRHDRDPLIGQVLAGQYIIDALLAKGGMGNIYLSRHQRLGRPYAVKVLRREFCEDRKVVKRFVREALAVSQLDHPHTAQVFDHGETDDGIHFIVMELLKGESLDRRLARVRQLPPDISLAFVGQAAAALAEAHLKGIVHRDLKPANIFICTAEDIPDYIKVLDFGIAKFYTGGQKGAELTKLTQAGSTMGTPHYMAPEQIRGEDVDGRADIYSLGVILWEALVGAPPFDGDSPMEIFLGHLEQKLPKISSVSTDVAFPMGLEGIISKALAKKPADRYGSMREFKTGLDVVAVADPARLAISQRIPRLEGMDGGGLTAVPTETQLDTPALKKRRLLLLVAALAAILIVSLIGLLVIIPEESSSPEPGGDRETSETVIVTPGHIKVYSDPPGAQVAVGGKQLGITPLYFQPDSDHTITLELQSPNRKRVSIEVKPVENEVRGLTVVLPPADGEPDVGEEMTVWLESKPSGAFIYMDGRSTGYRTPYPLPIPTETTLPVEIVIRSQGFLDERYIAVPQPGSVALSSTLVPR